MGDVRAPYVRRPRRAAHHPPSIRQQFRRKKLFLLYWQGRGVDAEPLEPRATPTSHRGCFWFVVAKFLDSALALQEHLNSSVMLGRDL